MNYVVDSFHFFRTSWIKTKLIKPISGYRHWTSEMSSSMCCVDLNNDTLKILSTHFSYKEKLKEENNFTAVTNTQRVMKIWKNCFFYP